ncbi:NADP-dependent oxidoreductase [Deinococcus yavapaiensis]|uniref:NADPH:quinone reductase-like Zn-dependent oxidoreductase n=1 Tax=Deinococcus yavapaiensis KR-236 TaxID=694435 RepID=A0A318S5B7_9DEIO|nr:NADP-dependent oxidoreductase [Deinococcus yavapaiensis]PYE53745.1 NADPH:quinone reductase-like Zn-dependent oxidoreductase [Deinococcus yavapaiensis KR-236]
MKAMTIHAYGDPDVFRLEDLPLPSPAPGEVLVRVRALSVNPVDTKWRRKGPFGAFPVVLGWDVSGTVEALGDGVSAFEIGDAVFGMVRFPSEGRAYAQYVAAPASHLHRVPTSLGFRDAAAMTLAALTAQQGLTAMRLQAGQTVLIHAAAGGVGHFAVQLAKLRGARVIGTASTRNHDFVRSLGADEVIDYRARPFEEQVERVDAVFDCVGGETQTRSFAVLEPGGTLVTIVGKPSQELAASRGVTAIGFLVHPSNEDLAFLAARVDAAELRPHVSEVLSLEKMADAHRAVESGRTVGKIVLDVE